MGDTQKLVLWIIGIAVVIYIWNFEPQVIQGLVRTGGKFLALAFGIVMLIVAARSFWVVAIRGQNDGSSAPVDNPGSIGNRSAGIFLGVMQLAFGLSALGWLLGFFD